MGSILSRLGSSWGAPSFGISVPNSTPAQFPSCTLKFFRIFLFFLPPSAPPEVPPQIPLARGHPWHGDPRSHPSPSEEFWVWQQI